MPLTEAEVIRILDNIKGDTARRIRSTSQTLEGRIKETARQLPQQFKEAFKDMTAKDVINALKQLSVADDLPLEQETKQDVDRMLRDEALRLMNEALNNPNLPFHTRTMEVLTLVDDATRKTIFKFWKKNKIKFHEPGKDDMRTVPVITEDEMRAFALPKRVSV